MNQENMNTPSAKAGENNKIKLYQPCLTEFDKYAIALQFYTIQQMRPWAEGLYAYLKGNTVETDTNGSFILPYIHNYLNKKTAASKNILINFLAIFWAEPRNYVAYLESLPLKLQEVWRIIVKQECITHSQAKKIMGQSIIQATNDRWYRTYTHTSLSIQFILRANGPEFRDASQYITEINLYIPSPLRAQLIPWALRKDYGRLSSYPSLPDKDLFVFNAEPFLFVEAQLITNWHQQRKLQLNDKYKLQAAQIKQAITITKPKEFFDTKDSFVKNLRANLFIQVYALHLFAHPQDTPGPETIKRIFTQTIPKYFSPCFTLLLPHVSGLKLSTYKYLSYNQTKTKAILDEIVKVSPHDWIATEDLFYYCLYKKNDLSFPLEHKSDEYSNKWTNDTIYPDSYYKSVTEALYRGFLFLMAAFGIIEIAYEPLDPDKQDTPSNTLQYIRLTQLGLYVFGISKNYKYTDSQDTGQAYFSLDSQMLVIRSLCDNNPYEALLASIAEPIGQKRYRVNPSSLLNNCNTLQDVENIIQFFKRFISKEPPVIWVDFFLSLQLRTNPLSPVASSKYTIYQLNNQNEELLKLISTDPEIRQYTLRAEKYLLLVETERLIWFINRLKSYGYLFITNGLAK